MPLRLVPYEQQVGLDGGPRMPRAQAPDLGAGPGKAITAAALGLSRLAGAHADAAEQERQRQAAEDAKAWVANAMSGTRLEWATQLLERQEKVEPGAPGFTDGLLKDFDDYVRKLHASAPKEAKQLLATSVANMRDNLGIQAQQFEKRSRLDWRKDTLNEAIGNGARTALADPTQAGPTLAEQLAVIDAADLPPEMKSAVRERAQREISSAALMGRINRARTDPAALDGILQAIQSGAVPHVPAREVAIAEGRVMGFQNQIQRDAERREREAEVDRVRQAAFAASDLEIAVHRRQAGYADIETAYRSGLITPAKRTQLTLHIDEENRKAVEKARAEREQLARVGDALNGRGFLDFRSEGDRKAVDAFYSQVFQPAAQKRQLDPAQRAQAVADFTARTGIIPSPVRQSIRGALRAGAPEAKAAAADLLDRLKTANPGVVEDFNERDIALGNIITTQVRAGVPVQSAVDLATQALAVPEAEREARRTRYSADKAAEKNLKRLEKELTGFRVFSPSLPPKVPDAMAGEFETIVRQEFVRGGDLEAAQKTALDHLKRVWGVTNVDKKPAWMKYAPETVYAVPGESGSWIRDQLNEELRKGAIADPKAEFTLAADSITAREQRPSYVVLQRRDGVLEPLRGADGKPLRYRPDYASSKQGAARRKSLEAQSAEAADVLAPTLPAAALPGARATPGGGVTSILR